ncbi:hypothetical protein IMZ48_16775 [Candidatus Bathyarchaeota archaeon]|nr:hypothetical protein [Candidatus Bathyarchaeota archaeon]
MRLQSIVSFAAPGSNATWGYADVLTWSTVETRVGAIFACMPTLRLALVRCSRVFRDTMVGNSYYQQRKSYQNISHLTRE